MTRREMTIERFFSPWGFVQPQYGNSPLYLTLNYVNEAYQETDKKTG
jgi:hypothetical protein